MQTIPGVALVTGGSSGIGRASAIALARAGWQVCIAGRREDELLETVRLSSLGEGKEMLSVQADLTKVEEVDGLFKRVVDKFGRLDLLFNNAGISGPRAKFEDIKLEDFQQVVNINLVAPFLCSQHAFRIMKEQGGGRIIQNGSISAHTPRPSSAPYTSTKHAITGLTKSLALDGRAYNIAVSQIDIGNAESSMGSVMRTGVPQPDGTIRPEAVMAVDHVARSIVFMASFPLDANVLNQTIMATTMPFVGRG